MIPLTLVGFAFSEQAFWGIAYRTQPEVLDDRHLIGFNNNVVSLT
jgi:hypothetical protein